MPTESQNSLLGNRDVENAPLSKPVASTELLPTTDLIILKPSHHVTSQRRFVLLMYSVRRCTFFGGGEFAELRSRPSA
jgi:hypothetical protein